MLHILAYVFIGLTGVSFGLIGAGGAILTVPIMVYMMGVPADRATGYALPVSLLVSATGAGIAFHKGQVQVKKAIEFGIPTAAVSFFVRAFVLSRAPSIVLGFPLKSALMYGFAAILFLASLAMIRAQRFEPRTETHPLTGIGLGVIVGLISGIFGVGGGFMIVPILVLFFGIPMSDAVGTSLFSVVFITLFGFAAEVFRHPDLPWGFLAGLISCAVVGMVLGSMLRQRVDGNKLKTGFGYFVFCVGLLTLALEMLRVRSN